MEWLMSTLFVLVFLAQQRQETCLAGENNYSFSSFIISITLGVCVFAAYPITGSCLNPAIALSATFFNLIDKGSAKAIKSLWSYLIFPFLGSLTAVAIYKQFFSKVQMEAKVNQQELQKANDSKLVGYEIANLVMGNLC